MEIFGKILDGSDINTCVFRKEHSDRSNNNMRNEARLRLEDVFDRPVQIMVKRDHRMEGKCLGDRISQTW